MSTNSGGDEGGGEKTLTAGTSDAVTPSMVGGGTGEPKRMRTFQEILAEETEKRNILEVKVIRLFVTNEDGTEVKAKALTAEDVSILIFDIIKLNADDSFGIALHTSRYNTKEIKLKPGVDPTPYLTDTPILFKNHEVTVIQQTTKVVKVTFKNVPFNVPDEEIINLCECYGKAVRKEVKYEAPNKNTRGIFGSTRYVYMEMERGKQFENFYWMEGPLESDQGSRITVLHGGQVQQCSHCLRRADSCPANGMGRMCENKGTTRGMMADYMNHLKYQHNYMSLKQKYQMEEYPLLGGRKHLNDGFGHIVEQKKG